jgi:hypothetical protein
MGSLVKARKAIYGLAQDHFEGFIPYNYRDYYREMGRVMVKLRNFHNH